jgi:hypothetical protein
MHKAAILFLLSFALPVFAQNAVTNTNSPQALVPAGYVITETIRGDLNKDGLDDYVFLIKATRKSAFVKDDMRGLLDRNRRGLVVVFNEKNKYTVAFEGRDCFSSENEDGGVYFPPQLDIFIEKGNLFVHYAHGRYGYWRFNFRYQNPYFVLIGYDSEATTGPYLLRSVSINLLTHKSIITENTNPNYKPVRLKTKSQTFKLENPIRLGDIPDFDACIPALLDC